MGRQDETPARPAPLQYATERPNCCYFFGTLLSDLVPIGDFINQRTDGTVVHFANHERDAELRIAQPDLVELDELISFEPASVEPAFHADILRAGFVPVVAVSVLHIGIFAADSNDGGGIRSGILPASIRSTAGSAGHIRIRVKPAHCWPTVSRRNLVRKIYSSRHPAAARARARTERRHRLRRHVTDTMLAILGTRSSPAPQTCSLAVQRMKPPSGSIRGIESIIDAGQG
jgi:hypothetical protein